MTTSQLNAAHFAAYGGGLYSASASDVTQFEDTLSDIDIDIISISSGSDQPPPQLPSSPPTPSPSLSPVSLITLRKHGKGKKQPRVPISITTSATASILSSSPPAASVGNKRLVPFATTTVKSVQSALAAVIRRLDNPNVDGGLATTDIDRDADDELSDADSIGNKWEDDSHITWGGESASNSVEFEDGDWDITLVPRIIGLRGVTVPSNTATASEFSVNATVGASTTPCSASILSEGFSSTSVIDDIVSSVLSPDVQRNIKPDGQADSSTASPVTAIVTELYFPPMSPPAPPPPSRDRSPSENTLDPPDRCTRPAQPPQPKNVPSADEIAEYWKTGEPLSEWVADYIWAICCLDLQNAIASRRVPKPTPPYLADAIKAVLRQTLLSPAGIFLALYYIQKLPVTFLPTEVYPLGSMTAAFRLELFGNKELLEQAPYRLFCMGAMLANKWLEDNTFTNKTWHDVSGLALRDLTLIENYALALLAYDLTVSDSQWSEWLGTLRKYHIALPHVRPPLAPIGSAPLPDPHATVLCAIDSALRDHGPVTPHFREAQFVGISKRIATKAAQEEQLELDFDIDEGGPLREEYIPRRRSIGERDKERAERDRDLLLPPPARWSPEQDEIVSKPKVLSAPYLAPSVTAAPAPTSFQPKLHGPPPMPTECGHNIPFGRHPIGIPVPVSLSFGPVSQSTITFMHVPTAGGAPSYPPVMRPVAPLLPAQPAPHNWTACPPPFAYSDAVSPPYNRMNSTQTAPRMPLWVRT